MDRQTIMHDLTLMLLSLSSWEEEFAGFTQRRSWKGYDFSTLDLLEAEGFIGSSRKSKSVVLSDEGTRKANELLVQYGIALNPKPEAQPFFRFSLSFDFRSLSCERTLLVPEHITFEDFHTMIQACLNWMNYHLYNFSLTNNGKRHFISWPDYETGEDPRLGFLPEDEEETRWVNSATTFLDEYFPKTREAVYSYDYGDGWEISVCLLNHGESLESNSPICTDGSGDAPPEDVGGEGGFSYFLSVIDDPSDIEYDLMRTWGEDQGFEHFKKELANKRLSHWQDWARADTGAMPQEAQIRAFGRVIAEPTHQVALEDAQKYLVMFEDYLGSLNLAQKTMRTHVDNVELFLDDYLVPRGLTVSEGLDALEDYLGRWLINSYDYSSKTLLKGSATSLNKFYSYLADNDFVNKDRQREVQGHVRQHLADWVADIQERDVQRIAAFMEDWLSWNSHLL